MMKKLTKINTFIFCFVVFISGCHKGEHRDLQQIQNTSTHTKQEPLPSEQNVLFTKPETAVETTNTQENIMEYNPVDVVDGILAHPSKNINIGIVVPATGTYASAGKTILESAMMTVAGSEFQNAGTVKVYNIGKLTDKDWQQNNEVKKLLKDDNDIVVGSLFKETTEKLLSVLPEDKPVISFINDEKLLKKHPNLTVISMNDGFKIVSLLRYLHDQQRQFLSLVLPSTKKGHTEEKLFRKLAPKFQIFIVNSQFYQENSQASMRASIKSLNRFFTTTYLVDDNGQFYTETYKQNKAKQKELKNLQDKSTVLAKTQQAETNAIYVGGNENALNSALTYLSQTGVLDRNVQFFSDAIIQPENTATTKLDNVMYIGYNYNYVDRFNKRFHEYFGHQPNYYAYLTHDVLAMIAYIANTGSMLPRNFYTSDGFRGVLDEFRFTRDGSVERRFGLYQLKNETMSRVFIPEDYLSLDEVSGRSAKTLIYK